MSTFAIATAVAVGALALLWLQWKHFQTRLERLERERDEALSGPFEALSLGPGKKETGEAPELAEADNAADEPPKEKSSEDTIHELEDTLQERQKAIESFEEELREAREDGERNQFFIRYLDCILDSMTSGVMVFDILSRFTLLNREAEAILKKSGEELVGRMLIECPNLQGLFTIINSVRGNRPLVTRSNSQMEAVIEDFDGNLVPLGVSINGLVDSDGTVMGYVVICKDLSERKRMMANLERAEKLSALGTMASGVAHNFNNILAAILGRVQLLLRYPDKAKILEGLKTIEKSALDGAATVKRIQDFARKRPVQEDFTSVEINEVVRDVISFTRARWESSAKESGRKYNVVTDLQADRHVPGSPSELREVFINLVINAIDAMPEGGTLTINSKTDGSTVRISVADSGTGMSDDVRRRIFDPFFTTKGVKGTGLGLSESYGIIKRHKGTIACESREQRGTKFIIDLPVTYSRPELVSQGERPKLDRKLKILVVDDDEAQCDLLRDILSAEEHVVEIALNGQKALDLLDEHKDFDAVISDLAMPGLDGWTVISKAKERFSQLRTIIMSGLGAEFPEEKIEQSGVDICLAKPLTLEMLISALAKLFSEA